MMDACTPVVDACANIMGLCTPAMNCSPLAPASCSAWGGTCFQWTSLAVTIVIAIAVGFYLPKVLGKDAKRRDSLSALTTRIDVLVSAAIASWTEYEQTPSSQTRLATTRAYAVCGNMVSVLSVSSTKCKLEGDTISRLPEAFNRLKAAATGGAFDAGGPSFFKPRKARVAQRAEELQTLLAQLHFDIYS